MSWRSGALDSAMLRGRRVVENWCWFQYPREDSGSWLVRTVY